LPPAPYLRNEIKVKPGFSKARLYVTALGVYEFSLNGKKWQKAEVYPDRPGRLVQAYPAQPVQITGTLTVKGQTRRPDGAYILDMGQNFAGTVRLRVKGLADDAIRLRYGEKLLPDGRLMTENLRMVRATDT